MNRSADRLNLCLSELKGAEQLKNFSPFFLLLSFDREMIFFLVRNGNLRKKKEKKPRITGWKFEFQFSRRLIVYFLIRSSYFISSTVKEKECFSKTKIETRWI